LKKEDINMKQMNALEKMKALEQTDAQESQATHNTLGGLPFLSAITNADVTGG
jgi:hypothetical protein